MKTNAPKRITVIISLVLGILGIAGKLVPIVALAPYAFWLVVAAFVLVTLGSLFEGL